MNTNSIKKENKSNLEINIPGISYDTYLEYEEDDPAMKNECKVESDEEINCGIKYEYSSSSVTGIIKTTTSKEENKTDEINLPGIVYNTVCDYKKEPLELKNEYKDYCEVKHDEQKEVYLGHQSLNNNLISPLIYENINDEKDFVINIVPVNEECMVVSNDSYFGVKKEPSQQVSTEFKTLHKNCST